MANLILSRCCCYDCLSMSLSLSLSLVCIPRVQEIAFVPTSGGRGSIQAVSLPEYVGTGRLPGGEERKARTKLTTNHDRNSTISHWLIATILRMHCSCSGDSFQANEHSNRSSTGYSLPKWRLEELPGDEEKSQNPSPLPIGRSKLNN